MPSTITCVHIGCATNLEVEEVRRERTFSFPRDDNLRREWLVLMNRVELTNMSHQEMHNRGHRVCWLHFRDDQFQTPQKKKLHFRQKPMSVLPTVAEPEPDMVDENEKNVPPNMQETQEETRRRADKSDATPQNLPPTKRRRKGNTTLRDLGVTRKKMTTTEKNLYARLQTTERLLTLSRKRGRRLLQKCKNRKVDD